MINTVYIGNIAFDTNIFYTKDKEEKTITNNFGGACFYSAIPASIFYKVGIVGRVGSDFDVSVFDKYNIDTSGLKILENEETTRFTQVYKDIDHKKRDVYEKINNNMLVECDDIPKAYLNSKHIHITTNEPSTQLKLVEYIRKNSKAIISIDTIKGYSNDPLTKKVFNLVDIAFVDSDFENLQDCNSKIKIIKYGKKGCHYLSPIKEFFVNVTEVPVVDKTGAGDCMNGVFINLIANGHTEEEALKIATKVATLSITDYGIEHVKEKVYSHNLKL